MLLCSEFRYIVEWDNGSNFASSIALRCVEERIALERECLENKVCRLKITDSFQLFSVVILKPGRELEMKSQRIKNWAVDSFTCNWKLSRHYQNFLRYWVKTVNVHFMISFRLV